MTSTGLGCWVKCEFRPEDLVETFTLELVSAVRAIMCVRRERVLVLGSTTDLEEARRMVRWIGRPHFSDVRLAIASVDDATHRGYAQRLLALFNDCGCGWGQVGFLVAIPFVWWSLLAERGVTLFSIIEGSLMAAAVSIASKGLGLAWSRWRLLKKLRELEVLLTR